MKHLLLFFLLLPAGLAAQQIRIDLPRFPDREYVWLAFNGDTQDTLARGALDAKGQTVLRIPQQYKKWRGMSNLLLTGGGGLELILNGEGDFTVFCPVAKPAINDIHYTGSKENSFLLEQYGKQQNLLNKASVIFSAVQVYAPEDSLYSILSEEKSNLEKRFADLQRETARSPLYAARIRQLSDFYMAVGSRLDLTEKELVEEQRQFIRDSLDFSQLWNSGISRNVLSRWMLIEKEAGDSLLLSDTKALLARMQEKDTRETLLKKIVLLFQQFGKEGLIPQLNAGLLSPGYQAPKLYLPDNTTIIPVNSLVIFYESGSKNSENELLQLRDNYPVLQKKNIRVISVSAGADETVKNAGSFPWQQNICDGKGFDGVNFRNYTVTRTPAIFVIDDKGEIAGRYERLANYLK